MAKKTDQFKQWRKQRDENVRLSNRIEQIFTMIDPLFQMLKKELSTEKYIEALKILGVTQQELTTKQEDHVKES